MAHRLHAPAIMLSAAWMATQGGGVSAQAGGSAGSVGIVEPANQTVVMDEESHLLKTALPAVAAVFAVCCCAILWIGVGCYVRAARDPQYKRSNRKPPTTDNLPEPPPEFVIPPQPMRLHPDDRSVDPAVVDAGHAVHGVWHPSAWSGGQPTSGAKGIRQMGAAPAAPAAATSRPDDYSAISQYVAPARRLLYPTEASWEVADEGASACRACRVAFTDSRQRHHCRGCGLVYCSSCAPLKASLRYDHEDERMCARCQRQALGFDTSRLHAGARGVAGAPDPILQRHV